MTVHLFRLVTLVSLLCIIFFIFYISSYRMSSNGLKWCLKAPYEYSITFIESVSILKHGFNSCHVMIDYADDESMMMKDDASNYLHLQ